MALLYLFHRELFRLFLLMMKIDLFAFGGGFASLPLMLQEIVNVRGSFRQPRWATPLNRVEDHLMMALRVKYVPAAIDAEIGIVNIQAHTIVPATPHRTAVRRFVAPTPIMAPVIV